MDETREAPLESLLRPVSIEPTAHRLVLGQRPNEAIKLELYAITALPGDFGPHATPSGLVLVPCHVVIYIRLRKVRGKLQVLIEAPSCVMIGRQKDSTAAGSP